MSTSTELVVAGIPFRRTGREELAAAARERLDAGDEDGALALLLTDRDDWAGGPGPTEEDARAAMAAGTLREAMTALRYGPVADYFAYRWSDPTYLSGLALLDMTAGGCTTALELACGIGHYLRELGLRGIAATGIDVVFSKCWLAKRFVAPDATLICADAASPLPDGPFDLAFCHDALHYLPAPDRVCAELMRVAPRVVVGHAHNALVDNLSAGAPLSPEGYAALLPGARLHDDAQLTRTALRSTSPPPVGANLDLTASEAIGLVWGKTEPTERSFLEPVGKLRRNPLLDGDVVRWPSARYEQEYAALSPHLTGPPPADDAEAIRRRWLLDLPAAW